ncbi:MAG: hypothetical protein WAL59_27270, partial [Roseiarcus sp.]
MNAPAHGMGYSGRSAARTADTSAHFSFASSDFKVLGAFFCNFWQLVILAARQPGVAPSGTRPGTRCCRSEASVPIPFPGADSIFSRRCG